MTGTDVVNRFKVAPLATQAEIDAFATLTSQCDATIIVKCLELLTAKGANLDIAFHRKRCMAFVKLADGVADTRLFQVYVKAIKVADPVLRNALLSLLPKVKDPNGYGDLVSLLQSPDGDVRKGVCEALVNIGGKLVFDRLKAIVEDRKHPARSEAIDAAVRTGGHFAIPILQILLASNLPAERQLGLRYLGDTKAMARDTGAALELIAVCVADSSEQVAVQAITSFVKMCNEDQWFDIIAPLMASERVALVKSGVEGLKKFTSPRVLRVLERKLRGGPNAVRFAVLGVLDTIATDDVLPPLVEALAHKQLVVRTKAGEVLQRLSGSGKLDLSRTVMWLLRSTDVNVRRMALEIAKKIKDPNNELWPKLLQFLRDEDWWVREHVVEVLVELAGMQLTRHVVGYLADTSDVIRRFAVDILVRLKDPQSVGALVRVAQNDTDWWVREKAIEALVLIGDLRCIPYMEQLLQTTAEMRFVLVKALTDLNSIASAPLVATALADEDPDVRMLVLRSLQKLNDTKLGDAVRSRLDDPDPKVRLAAKDLLNYWNISLGMETAKITDGETPLDRLLIAMTKHGGDDLILASNRAPAMKRMGKVQPISNRDVPAEQMRQILFPLLTPEQVESLRTLQDIDMSYDIKAAGLRFRCNIFQEYGGPAAVFRIIRGKLPKMEELGLPKVMQEFANLRNGLVLVGGPTGSGKSTTLAAVINSINQNYARHIISLEDPIEVVHAPQKSLVTQREIGAHTLSYNNALRATLREDPDVILVGELRDLPTIQFAVTAAETGHLVFGTVHTVAVDSSVDRLINAFPPMQQEQVRSMLAQSLRAVCCQYLMKGLEGNSRHLAVEIMMNTDAIAQLIRQGKTHQLSSMISTGKEQGMQTMDSDLMRLLKDGKIDPDDAYMKARAKKDFEKFVPGAAQANAKIAAGESKPAVGASASSPSGSSPKIAAIPTGGR